MKIRLILGIILALPVTLVTGLFYIVPFWLLGWYKYYKVCSSTTGKSKLGIAPVWIVNNDKCPKFIQKIWSNWGGQCVGTLVVMNGDIESNKIKIILNHELHHVHQMHISGFLQPLFYLISSILCIIAGENGYVYNIFEIGARRAAGQVVEPDSFIQGFSVAKNNLNYKITSSN